MKRILFVHPPEGNAFELYKSFKFNKDFKPTFLSKAKGKNFSLLDKIRFKLKVPSDLYNYNKLLLNTDLNKYDILLIVKGIMIYPNTLKKIKKRYKSLKLVSFSFDDMYAWHNRSLFYTLGIKFYDLHITTKSYNVEELKSLGARKVYFHQNSYSKIVHRPLPKKDSSFSHDVLFIGALEKERFQSMCFLAENGIIVNIYTESWDKAEFKKFPQNIIMHKQGLFGDDYAEAISNSKVTLCFLRKMNRDLQTQRSVEIPACGGCMVAENTLEHLNLFKEGKEAMFFKNDDELLEIVNYLLQNEEVRVKIVHNSLERCEKSGYSVDDLVKILLFEFKKL